MRIVLVLALVVITASFLTRPAPVRKAAPVETEARAVVARLGGRIEELLVLPGQSVTEGQVIARVRVEDAGHTNERLREAMERLSRLPDSAWKQAEQSDPKRVAADREYVARLREWERERTPADEARLAAASARREAEYRKPSPFTKQAFLAWRDNVGRYELTAAMDGRVEILDWKAGDRLPAMARVALIAK